MPKRKEAVSFSALLSLLESALYVHQILAFATAGGHEIYSTAHELKCIYYIIKYRHICT